MQYYSPVWPNFFSSLDFLVKYGVRNIRLHFSYDLHRQGQLFRIGGTMEICLKKMVLQDNKLNHKWTPLQLIQEEKLRWLLRGFSDIITESLDAIKWKKILFVLAPNKRSTIQLNRNSIPWIQRREIFVNMTQEMKKKVWLSHQH